MEKRMALLGALFFPATILTEGLAAGMNAPWIPSALGHCHLVRYSTEILRSFGTLSNEARKIRLALGLVIPIMVFGLIASLGSTPLILVVDCAFAIFLRRLSKRYHFQPSILLPSSLPTFPSISSS